MPFVVFRADASQGLGGGHIIRCLVLASALSKRGWRCAFASNDAAVSVVPHLPASGHDLKQLAPKDADDPHSLAAAWQDGSDLLVVDHYSLDAAYESACRPWARAIMVIDDLADRPHHAEILLDQTLARDSKAYRGLVPDACRLLVGSKYALLRGEFSASRERALSARRGRGLLSRAFVSLGATDTGNVTGKVLEAVAASGLNVSVDVIAGPSNPHRASLSARLEALRIPGVLHVDPPAARIAELMAEADFAIGGGGTSAYERCCLGLPSVLVVMADNQRDNAYALRRAGAAACVELGKSGDPEAISEQILALARRPEVLPAMSAAAARICDGQGAQRVAEIVSGAIR